MKAPMRLFTLLSTGFVLFTLCLQNVAANDIANGKTIYDKNCKGCHTTAIHTRPDRIIFSKRALSKRIKFCERMAGAHWSEQQLNDVTEYLNETFYKFEN